MVGFAVTVRFIVILMVNGRLGRSFPSTSHFDLSISEVGPEVLVVWPS